MRKQIEHEIREYLKDYPKELREELHLTQAKMAERLCMEQRSYAYLEYQETTPSLLTLFLLMLIMGERKYDLLEDIFSIIEKHLRDGG